MGQKDQICSMVPPRSHFQKYFLSTFPPFFLILQTSSLFCSKNNTNRRANFCKMLWSDFWVFLLLYYNIFI